MEKKHLYVFYNLFMISLYLGIDEVRFYILTTLFMVNLCVLLYFSKDDNALMSWQATWFTLAFLFFIRDLGLVNEIWIVLALLLCFTFVATVTLTCYVIMTQKWNEQLFVLCALFWVVFHDSNIWLKDTPYMMFFPVFFMAYFRFDYERLPWGIILFSEAMYDMKQVNDTSFFVVTSLVYLYIIYKQNDWIVTEIVLTAPFSIPVFALICVYNYCMYGYSTNKTYDILLLKVSDPDPEITIDDTL